MKTYSIKTSPTLFILILILYLLAFFTLLLSPVNVGAKIGLGLGLTVYLLHQLAQITQHTSSRVCAMSYQKKQWLIHYSDHRVMPVKLGKSSVITRYFCLLHFMDVINKKNKKIFVTLCPDSLVENNFREVRMQFKMALRHIKSKDAQ